MEQIRFQGKTLLTFSELTALSHLSQAPILGPLLTLLLVTEGAAALQIDRNRYEMTPGDIFVINAVEQAHIEAVSPPKMCYVRLSFDSSFVASSSSKNTFDYRYLEMFYSRQHVATHKISAASPVNAGLRTLFDRIGDTLRQEEANYTHWVKALLMQLLLGILDYYEHDHMLNPQQDMVLSGNETIESVMSFIEENLSQTLTLPMFAEIAHMNPFYFSTFFKKHTSLSPMQYVLKARVHRAVCLLRETDKTILDIALLCGFNSTANFNKAFKKLTGKTPSDFRS